MEYRIAKTALGHVGVVFQDEKALRVFLPTKRSELQRSMKSLFPYATENESGMQDLIEMIVAYLEGQPIHIPLDFAETSLVSPFQLRVLKAECTIPRGMTASYSWLAKAAGTNAIRAAGSALARNPWPLIVPCHRAVRLDRTIGQYQGGAEMKRHLLEMEGVEFEDSGKVASSHFLP